MPTWAGFMRWRQLHAVAVGTEAVSGLGSHVASAFAGLGPEQELNDIMGEEAAPVLFKL